MYMTEDPKFEKTVQRLLSTPKPHDEKPKAAAENRKQAKAKTRATRPEKKNMTSFRRRIADLVLSALGVSAGDVTGHPLGRPAVFTTDAD